MEKWSPKLAIGQAHSKLILIGEHAVVYGAPAIALPFQAASVRVEITPLVGEVLFDSIFFQGILEDMPTKMKGLVHCIKAACQQLNQPVRHFKIKLISTIPIGRGLGSSAAIAVALVRGLFRFFNQPLSRETLIPLVDLAEQYAHGSPSGIDREATTSDHPIWFAKDEPTELVDVARPFYLIVGDTGRIGDTRAAVGHVRQLYQQYPNQTKVKIDQLTRLTVEARQHMMSGKLTKLGITLNLAQHELEALGVSDASLDHYITAAREAGALGAKLTGGGRGGCMIALADTLELARTIQQTLDDAGAAQTWQCAIKDGVCNYESQSSSAY